MHNSSYRTLQDDEEKYVCEVPVDPIFMQHTDKIVVKVLKNTVNINSHGKNLNKSKEKEKNSVVETIQAENNRKLSQDWKLSKRVTLPEDCNLDTIDVVCDKKKTVVRITCDKIPGHFRCGTSEG